MLRDAASGRDLTGWVDLYGAHRGRSIRGYPSAGAGVGGVARPGGVARVRGATAGGRSAGCRRVPPSRDPARVPRAPGPGAGRPAPHQGATERGPAHGAARGRATATGDPNVPAARAYVPRRRGVSRARARAPDRPSARVRTLSALHGTVGGAAPAVAPVPARARTVRYSVYTDLRVYARHCFRSLGPCAKGRKRRCHEGTRQTPHLVRGYQCADRWRETPGLIETSRQDCRATRHRRHPPGQCPRQQPPQGPAAAAQRQAQGMWGAPTAAGRWLCSSM